MNISERYLLGNIKKEDIVVGAMFIVTDYKGLSYPALRQGDLVQIVIIEDAKEAEENGTGCSECIECFNKTFTAFRVAKINKSTDKPFVQYPGGYTAYGCWYRFRKE